MKSEISEHLCKLHSPSLFMHWFRTKLVSDIQCCSSHMINTVKRKLYSERFENITSHKGKDIRLRSANMSISVILGGEHSVSREFSHLVVYINVQFLLSLFYTLICCHGVLEWMRESVNHCTTSIVLVHWKWGLYFGVIQVLFFSQALCLESLCTTYLFLHLVIKYVGIYIHILVCTLISDLSLEVS